MFSPQLSFLLFSFADWPHGQCNQANLYKVGFPWRVNGAETRVFVTGRIVCRWVTGCPPPENFQVLRLRNAIFRTCHEICLRKIDLEPENGKQLQVAIIKITESKENNSIHRLNVSGSTGPGGTCLPCSPPPPPASYGSGKIDVSTHEYFTPVNKIIEAMYWRSRVNVKVKVN